MIERGIPEHIRSDNGPEFVAQNLRKSLAEELGVDPATIKNWEAGLHQPTGKSLDVIARVLQVR
jgi:transcriptional regulator with XRE-family HTH domain